MLKKVSLLMMVSALALSVSAEAALKFSLAEPEVQAIPMKTYSAENDAVGKALTVHNLLNRMWEVQEKLKTQTKTDKNLKLQEKRMKAMEDCNVRRLSEEFKDPDKVWDKITKAYDKKEKDLTIYVNAAQGLSDEEQQKIKDNMSMGTMSDEQVAEVMSYWQIGQEILVDVYQNQDAWGERKTPTTPSFPLWEDQKYQFNQVWDDQYAAINAHFGVPADKRPAVGDEKYDYARHADVEAAHTAYLKELSKQNPSKAASLPDNLRQVPTAPKPLPPKEEMVFYIESDEPIRQVYPALPEPWQRYAEDGFKNVNPKGEMAADFAEGLVLKESAKHRTNEQQNNRLSMYQLLKKQFGSAQQIAQLMNDNVDESVASIQAELADYVSPEGGIDVKDAKTFQEMVDSLKALKAQLIQVAILRAEQDEALYQQAFAQTDEYKRLAKTTVIENVAADNPAYQQQLDASLSATMSMRDRTVIEALQKDEEGRVYLTSGNAASIDRMLREYEATKALDAQKRKWDREIEAGNKKPIDDLCINGGI